MAYALLRPLLFRFDAETVHHAALRLGARVGAWAWARTLIGGLCRPDPCLAVRAMGLDFPSPVGVAAGFDKNGMLVPLLDALGFGSVEVGTVTARPWGGNPRPRVFRLPADGAVINRMGLPNGGAASAAWRIREARRHVRGPIGVNVGRVADGYTDDAVADVVEAVGHVAGVADYITLNLSCPNTDDGRAFDNDPAACDRLFSAVSDALAGRAPWLVKISPDLEWLPLARMIDAALARGASGFVISNTTRSRDGLATPADEVAAIGAGGLSGRPLRERALTRLREVRRHVGEGPTLVGVGGIFSVDDVRERLAAGATLVQIYTGLVYGGPFLARSIHRALATSLR